MPDRSIATQYSAICPRCGASFTAPLWQVVDAEARPDLMRRACAKTLHVLRCSACWAGGVMADAAVAFFRLHTPIAIILAIPDDAPQDTMADLANGRLDQLQQALGADFRSEWVTDAMSSVLWWRLPTAIDEEWSDLPLPDQRDPLPTQVVALLAAATTTDVEAVVHTYPDLLDESAQFLLHGMLKQVTEQESGWGTRRRAFFDLIFTARTHGLRAARFSTPLLCALEAGTPERLTDARMLWNQAQLAANGLPCITATEAFIAQLDPQHDALLWAHAHQILGAERRKRNDSDRRASLDAAVEAFAIAIEGSRSRNLEMLVLSSAGMSQALQERVTGDRGENFERAIATCNDALAVAGDLALDPDCRSVVLDALGSAYIDRPLGDRIDNIERAVDALRRAGELATDDEGRAIALNNLARALSFRLRGAPHDNMTEAIAAYGGALAFFSRDDGMQSDAALAAMNLGATLLQRVSGDPADTERAIAHLTRAAQYFASVGADRDHLMVISNLATAYGGRGVGDRDANLIQAAAYADAAIRSAERQQAHMELAKARWNLATLLTTDARGTPLCDVPRAIALLEQALLTYTVDADPVACRRTAAKLGDLRLEQEDRDGALAAYDLAASAAESLRQRAFVPANQRGEIAVNTELFERCVALCAGGETPELRRRALAYAESGRARQFLDQVGLAPLTPPADMSPAALRHETELVSIIRTSDIALSGTAVTSLPSDRERTLAAEREAARGALIALWDDMSRASAAGARYAQLRRGDRPSWEDIASLTSALGDGAVLVSTFVLDDAISVCVMRGGWESPVTHRCPVTRDALQREYVDVFAREVLGHVEFRAQHGTPTHAWQGLGQLLFGPVIDHLAGAALVYVIPHGVLHHLPLHALTVHGAPLIEHVPVIVVPSAAILQRLRTRPRVSAAHETAVVVAFAAPGDPAREGIETEGRQVAKLLGVSMLSATEATCAELTKRAPEASYVHLACHGFFSHDDPLASGLELSDGVMSARDWMALSLACDLVMLSACETGQLQTSSGDELAGLMHALAFAGARSSLVTLWRVYSDAAMQWTIDFYTRLRTQDGAHRASVAKAYQQATLALRQLSDDVVVWAPFVLVGDAG